MPLNRRVPKFGFKNINRKEFCVVNVGDLQKSIDENKLQGTEINTDALIQAGLVRNTNKPVKVLGDGELTASLTVDVDAVTQSAKEKIEAAGGTVKTNG
jgi:large subunit ribosomal protein L15